MQHPVCPAAHASLDVFARFLRATFLVCAAGLLVAPASGAGVTIVTHGYSSRVEEWVVPMCDKIAQYRAFPGTQVSVYQLSITNSAGGERGVAFFLDGTGPAVSDSGEIVIALDWWSLSGGAYSTTEVAVPAAAALLDPNLIPELNGHALAEFPLHLVGHSRGVSLITEMARLLGAQGVWVNQVTSLDPHPVDFFGDANVVNYANILFVDNYWQNLGDNLLVPNGRSLPGAYNRQLTSLGEGYSSTHSDVHLWYHGTLDLTTRITVDSATIGATARSTWWTSVEAAGTNAGFFYSRYGGGDWLSTAEPGGTGKGRIRDGFNQRWNLGAGVANNRSALPTNSGLWPNVLRLGITGTNRLALGAPIPLEYYYQAGSNASASVTLQFFLDGDGNALNGNSAPLATVTLPATGTGGVASGILDAVPSPGTVVPGVYRVAASIANGTRSRFLYASRPVELLAAPKPVALLNPRILDNDFLFVLSGNAGQKVIVETSTDLADWKPVLTNVLVTGTLQVTNAGALGLARGFYRAVAP